MKKARALTIFGILMINLSFGQDRDKNPDLIDEAWKLYEKKEYLKSGEKYSEAFAASVNKGSLYDRYNAACSWALANQPDSAFVQLFKIAEIGNFTDIGHITSDTDLNSLHDDERWEKSY